MTSSSTVLSPSLRPVTVGLLLSVGIVAFDGLSVTTAMPAITDDLGGRGTYGWAVSALMLASVVGTVVGGFIADRRGPRVPYLVGFVVFTVGLVISASAPIWAMFLLGRVIQGLGMGAVMSMAYVLVAVIYPPTLQSRALALLSGAWTVPSLIGPLLSGILAENASWRWLFVLLVPFVAVAAIVTLRGIPRIDGGGQDAGLVRQLVFSTGLAVGAGVLLAGLEQHRIALLIPMVVVGAVVVAWTLREVTPTGTLRARRGVPAGIATRGVLSMSFFGIETFLPLAMTDLRGTGLTFASVALASGALVWVAGSMAQSRHEMRQGTHTRRADSVLGLLLLAVGIGIIAATLLSDTLPVACAVAGWIIGGFGMGLAYNASTSETFTETEPEAAGAMSGTIQMAQTLGTAAIAGVGTAVLAWTGDSGPDAGLAVIFALTAFFALATIPLALRIRTGNGNDYNYDINDKEAQNND